MFAGPNGSGKSTLKSVLPDGLLGVYLNADDVERVIRESGFLDFGSYGVSADSSGVLAFFEESPFLAAVGLGAIARALTFRENRLNFSRVQVNSYMASVAVEFLRTSLLRTRTSFTFETVMSHPGKVQDLARAQQMGYRT